MVGMGAGEVLPGGPAVEILVCMEPVVERGAGGAPFDQRGPAVEIDGDREGVIGKKKGVW